jgi:hypothetical protein
MAVNKGKGSRQGAIKERSQVYNPSTGNYVKRDSSTGRFLDVKSDGTPFKGVRKEKTNIKANPNVKKSVATKAESAVIKLKNGKKSS